MTKKSLLLATVGVSALALWTTDTVDKTRERRAVERRQARSADDARSLATRTDRSILSRSESSASGLPADARSIPRQRMARLAQGVSADSIASSAGLELVAYDARIDVAVFSGSKRKLARLADHPDVYGTHTNGIARGAGKWKNKGSSSGGTEAPSADNPRSLQWHLDTANVGSAPSGLADIVVAVVDSGVAYADWCGDEACKRNELGTSSQTHAQAKSLANTVVVAPQDFVDGDALPFDEHQHGTHIATTILGDGAIEGVAPGATLMPVRVLDENNEGSEFALIQGIWHAIDNGADIINLSLAFQQGFVPSPYLLEAIAAADEAGVLVVAASGNDGTDVTAWPAVAPKVVAVAASAPRSDYAGMSTWWNYNGIAHVAPYSNTSSAIDFVAPGGDLDADLTGDGYPDGILAETIMQGDPSATGYWYFEGTSQAAAIATGAAARAMALGATADETVWALQRPARPLRAEGPLKGVGSGYLNVSQTENVVNDGPDFLGLSRDTEVAVLPYLERGDDGRVRPAVRFTAVGATNWAGETVKVYATLANGDNASSIACTTDGTTGTCTATGDWVTLDSPTGEVWTVQVDGFHYAQDVIARPTGVVYATDALEAIFTAAADQGELPQHFSLGVFWDEGADPTLGNVAASFTFTSGGTGLATSPLGIIATPAAVLPGALSDSTSGTGLATSPLGFATLDLTTALSSGTGLATSPLGFLTIDLDDIADLDGTGLATSPLGFTSVDFSPTDLDLDGTGLATSPLGFIPAATLDFEFPDGTSSTVLTIDGTGLATSPLGFHGGDLLQPGDGGADLSGADIDGSIAIPDTMSGAGTLLGGTEIGQVLDLGGFATDSGTDAGALMGAETLSSLSTGAGVGDPIYLGPAQ